MSFNVKSVKQTIAQNQIVASIKKWPKYQKLFIPGGLVLALVLVELVVIQNSQNYKRSASADSVVNITVNLNSPSTVSQFQPGATLTQTDTNYSNATEEQQLGSALGYMNVSIMGWGTDNPEPSPGQYDWSTLDPRVQAIQATGVTGMITLCCSPDWMKGGKAGQTNWNNLTVAPLPAHYQDFANLSAQVAQRYPNIKYFQVWNELKGFYNNDGSFNTTGYMQLYNDVYTAIKAVRPDALIGGPYIGMSGMGTATNNVVSQWLNTKNGGDFVAVDGGFNSTSSTDDFTGASFYTTFGQWLRQQPNGGATLPFGWAEWYPGTVQDWKDLNHYNATMTNAMIDTVQSGAFYALTWGVEGGLEGVYKEGDGQQEGLLSGGKPTPFYYSLQDLKTYFAPGTQLYNTTISQPTVSVLASQSKTLLVNQLGSTQNVTVNGQPFVLTAYQVAVINTPTTSQQPSSAVSPTPTSTILTPANPTPTSTPIPTPTPTVIPTPTSGTVGGANLFQNPSFETTGKQWLNPWRLKVTSGTAAISQDTTTASAANGKYSAKIAITKARGSDYNIQLMQGPLSVTAKHLYTLSFWAKSSAKRTIRVDLQKNYSPYTTYVQQTFSITPTWTLYGTTFTQSATDNNTIFDFNVANATGNVWIDNVSMY